MIKIAGWEKRWIQLRKLLGKETPTVQEYTAARAKLHTKPNSFSGLLSEGNMRMLKRYGESNSMFSSPRDIDLLRQRITEAGIPKSILDRVQAKGLIDKSIAQKQMRGSIATPQNRNLRTTLRFRLHEAGGEDDVKSLIEKATTLKKLMTNIGTVVRSPYHREANIRDTLEKALLNKKTPGIIPMNRIKIPGARNDAFYRKWDSDITSPLKAILDNSKKVTAAQNGRDLVFATGYPQVAAKHLSTGDILQIGDIRALRKVYPDLFWTRHVATTDPLERISRNLEYTANPSKNSFWANKPMYETVAPSEKILASKPSFYRVAEGPSGSSLKTQNGFGNILKETRVIPEDAYQQLVKKITNKVKQQENAPLRF